MEDLQKTIDTAMKSETALIYNGRKLEGYDKSAARIAMMLLEKAVKNESSEN